MSPAAGSRQHRHLISLVHTVSQSRSDPVATQTLQPPLSSPPPPPTHLGRLSPPTASLSPPPPSPPLPPPPPPPPLLCTLAMAGIQICYAAQINLGTAHLVHLGLRHSYASLAWLAGPLSGLLCQPLIGALSDECTHPLGRRRPFLIGGCACTCISLLAFANAQWLSEHAPLPVAIAAFFTLDFSIQAIQAPLRALVIDVMPAAKLSTANSCIALYCGIGNLVGGFLAALPWSKWFPFVSNTQVVFGISAVLLVITTSLTVICTPEQALNRSGMVSSSSSISRVSSSSRMTSSSSLSSHSSNGWRRVYKTLRAIPSPFWSVFCVQLCTWCGFFALFVYVNTWIGHNVFLGNGSKQATPTERRHFDVGVRLGGTANAMAAVITIGYSWGLPRLIRLYGVRNVYLFSQGVEAFTLMVATLIRAHESPPSRLLQIAAVMDVGLFGVVWATTVSLPWTLIVHALDSDAYYAAKKGLFTTVFNACQCLPQMAVALVAPAILAVRNDEADVMMLGGVVALLGALLVLRLRIDAPRRPNAKGDANRSDAALSSTRVW